MVLQYINQMKSPGPKTKPLNLWPVTNRGRALVQANREKIYRMTSMFFFCKSISYKIC